MCEDLLSALDDYRDHTTNPHLEKTLARAYAEITNLNTRIAELEDLIASIEKLEDLIARVSNELHDPMGECWCSEPEKDRDLLESLRDHVDKVMGWGGER